MRMLATIESQYKMLADVINAEGLETIGMPFLHAISQIRRHCIIV
jgi:hypothetical protein